MQVYINLDYVPEIDENMPIFFCGCDFECPWCYVSDILSFDEESLIDVRDVKKKIQNSTGLKSVIFTGGEPLLQRQALLSLARFAKKLELKTVLDTNGSKPNALKSLLKAELIDEVRMDIKCELLPDRFEKVTNSKTFFISTGDIIENIRKSISILKDYEDKVKVIFQTIIVPSVVYKKEQIERVATEIQDVRCVYQLKPFSQGKHINKSFSDISSPTKNFINSLKEHISNKFPTLIVE